MGNNQLYTSLTGKTKIEAVRAMVREHLQANGCVDCPESDWRCLQFDHRERETKSFSIAAALSNPGHYTLIRVANEMGKCDVRCANCHQKRTIIQRGYWRNDEPVSTD